MVKVAPEFREMYPKEKKLIWRRFHSCPVGREFLAEEPVHPFGCCYHYREWVHATTADFLFIDLNRRKYNFVTGNFWTSRSKSPCSKFSTAMPAGGELTLKTLL